MARSLAIADLGCGLGYSTLWLAEAAGPSRRVVGIDADAGLVAEVLLNHAKPFDLIHDDAWFGRAPDHLDTAVGLLRPGGVLTMANCFLLVDALTGPRNNWAALAGPTWAEDTITYARQLAERADLAVSWITKPPVGLAVKVGP